MDISHSGSAVTVSSPHFDRPRRPFDRLSYHRKADLDELGHVRRAIDDYSECSSAPHDNLH